jgi:hypothetical protein
MNPLHTPVLLILPMAPFLLTVPILPKIVNAGDFMTSIRTTIKQLQTPDGPLRYLFTCSDNLLQYWLSVDNVIMAPDGVSREMMVYNGSFPGPLIEANWGDTLVIHVTNNLSNANGYRPFA